MKGPWTPDASPRSTAAAVLTCTELQGTFWGVAQSRDLPDISQCLLNLCSPLSTHPGLTAHFALEKPKIIPGARTAETSSPVFFQRIPQQACALLAFRTSFPASSLRLTRFLRVLVAGQPGHRASAGHDPLQASDQKRKQANPIEPAAAGVRPTGVSWLGFTDQVGRVGTARQDERYQSAFPFFQPGHTAPLTKLDNVAFARRMVSS